MSSRCLLIPISAVAFFAMMPGLASAAWPTSGSGAVAAKGGAVGAPVFTTDTCTGKSPSTVNLAWSAATNATAYRVEKSTDGTTYTVVSSSTTTRTFSDNTTLSGRNKDLYVRVTSLSSTAWTSTTVVHHATDNGANCT